MTEPPSPLRMLLSRHTRRREFITLLGGAAGRFQYARSNQRSCKPSGSWARPRLRPGAHGPPLLCSGCANSAGPRAETSQSRFAGAEGRTERFAEIAAEFVRL